MDSSSINLLASRETHSWLRMVNVAYVPGQASPLLDQFSRQLLQHFKQHGHTTPNTPQPDTDVLLTTASFGEPLNWREALSFTARRRFNLQQRPLIFTLMHLTPEEFQQQLDYFERVLAKEPPDPADFAFPGLAPRAFHTLYEQGRRGGPILAFMRMLQSQALSVRIILLIGHDHPLEAYTFDLVGAYPRTDASDLQDFYDELVFRIVTAASTHEITDHQVMEPSVPQPLWQSLSTPTAMIRAGKELGTRHFFTEMVRVSNLVDIPGLEGAVSSQYSEGCFATWESKLNALIVTVTGSARPVDKDRLTDDELALITGVRPDGLGAVVRHVEGKRNDPPSSEAVELMEMDAQLPHIVLGAEWGDLAGAETPVARSKLHGHRGVSSFDPEKVEHVALDAPYYHYPVSCSTEAQARAIQTAFERSSALAQPSDPRQVIFTVLPGHGVVIVEKWVPGKAPFQVIWEYMDAGLLTIENQIPQGLLTYLSDGKGRMVLQTIGD